MRSPNSKGTAVVEFLAAGLVLGAVAFSIIQCALLWAGQGAVETASHFAARQFALTARTDCRKAKEAALAEAMLMCLNRPGGRSANAAMTTLDFSRNGSGGMPVRAIPGDAYRVRLTHWVELAVPWIDRLLFSMASCPKTRIGGRYYLGLQATRWVTVE